MASTIRVPCFSFIAARRSRRSCRTAIDGFISATKAARWRARILNIVPVWEVSIVSPSIADRCLDQAAQRLDVGVAAGNDDADSPSLVVVAAVELALEQGGRRKRAGGLDHDFHALPHPEHAAQQFGIAYRQHVMHV